MKKNLGTVDMVLRILASVAIGVLLLTGVLAGAAATILGVVAIVLLLTGVVRFCPIYYALKISTRKDTPAA